MCWFEAGVTTSFGAPRPVPGLQGLPAPPPPLFGLPQVVVTPHLGASTREAQDKAGDTIDVPQRYF